MNCRWWAIVPNLIVDMYLMLTTSRLFLIGFKTVMMIYILFDWIILFSPDHVSYVIH